MLEALDAAGVRRWCETGLARLSEQRGEIDDLNVYPVPDGDTGTNLVLTFEAVAEALRAEPAAGLPATVRAMARGALLGARGNSGVIASQLLRGLAETWSAADTVSGCALAEALSRAADLAYAAVAVPVEGTVLMVARAAADGAQASVAAGEEGLAAVAAAACRAAAVALDRTPSQLAQLAAAGVVDAGGRGLCVLLDALLSVVTGERAPEVPLLLVPRDRTALTVAREGGSDAYAYEVQYLLDAPDEAVDRLRTTLAPLGDSLVVVGGDGLWNVHVHVNDVGAAVEAGVEAGRPWRITVTRFADQVAAERPVPAVVPRSGRAVVAVTPGAGLADLFVEAGAAVVDGGPTANPSTGELLDAVLATGAAEVVVLPNDGNAHGAAAAAAREARAAGVTVAVIPTRASVQGLAALAVADPDRPLAEDVIAMSAASGATRWAEVTTAVREAATMVGVCRPGDVLGLLEGDVVLIGRDVQSVARDLLDRMLRGGGELATVVTGADAPEGLGERLAAHLREAHPVVETVVYDGGQPHYPVLLGVE